MSQIAAVKYRMAVVSPLEARLRAWGMAFGVREYDDREPATESPLHRASLDRSREGQAVEQGAGFSRTRVQLRRLRATQGDRCKVPDWAGSDPVRGTETRSPAAPWHPPSSAQAVEDAVLALGRWDIRAALALRACYCLLGRRPQSERIGAMTYWGAANVSRIGYRAALSRGRIAIGAALKIDG